MLLQAYISQAVTLASEYAPALLGCGWACIEAAPVPKGPVPRVTVVIGGGCVACAGRAAAPPPAGTHFTVS